MIWAMLAIVILRIFYSAAEVCFERDWPRSTWRGLLLSLILLGLCFDAFGQATRVDIPILTSGQNVATNQGAMPQAIWVGDSTAIICTHPSASYAACQGSPIPTYTDATQSTLCPTNQQLVQLPGNTCTQFTGVQANLGFWYTGGLFDYWVSTAYGTFGPFTAGITANGVVLNSIPSSGPAIDIRNPAFAGGAVIDGVTDIGPSLTAAVGAANATANNAPVILLPCNQTVGGCYLADGTTLSSLSGSRTLQIKLQGSITLGTALIIPNSVQFICDGGSAPGQFTPKGPNCAINTVKAKGTLGTSTSTGSQTFTPTFTTGSISNLKVGGAITVIDPTTCALTGSITRVTAGSVANVTATYTPGSCGRIRPGFLITIAGVADTTFNGTAVVLSNDYLTGTITWYQAAAAATSSGGTIASQDDDTFESCDITAVSGANVTCAFNHAHSASALWGAVGVQYQKNSFTGHFMQGVDIAGAYGASLRLIHNAEVLMDGVSVGSTAYPASIPLEVASSFGWHFQSGSLLTTYQFQCNFNCSQPSYPDAVRVTSASDQTVPDPSTLNAIIDGNTFIIGGIKVDTNGNNSNVALNKIGDIRLRDVTIEQPAGSVLYVDPRFGGSTNRGFTFYNVLMQDNFIKQSNCQIVYTDPSTTGQLTITNLNATNAACFTGKYYGGKLSVNGVDYTQGALPYPRYSGSTGVLDDGRIQNGELGGQGGNMSPSLVPVATSAVTVNPASWTCSGTGCSINVVQGPDWLPTSAGELVAGSGLNPSITVFSANFSTTVNDVVIAGVWCRPGVGSSACSSASQLGTPYLVLSLGGDIWDNTGSSNANPSNYQSGWTGQPWVPIVGMHIITTANATSHTIQLKLYGPAVTGNSMLYSQPFLMYIPYANKPATWTDAQWFMELARIRTSLLHAHVSPSMPAGGGILDIGSAYKLYWGSDTDIYRDAAGVLRTNGTMRFDGVATSPSTSPVCPNGTNGALTTSGCTAPSPLTTKGDLLGYNTAAARIPVGTDGQVLQADSTQTLGVRWANPAAGGANMSFFAPYMLGAGSVTLVANAIIGYAFNLGPNPISVAAICKNPKVADNTANLYDIGISDTAGNLLAHLGATAGTTFAPNTNAYCNTITAGPVVLQPGSYILEVTTNCASACATLGNIAIPTSDFSWTPIFSSTGWGTTTGGALPSTSTPPTAVYTSGAFTYIPIWFGLHP